MRFPYDEWANALKYYRPTSTISMKAHADDEKENEYHRIHTEIQS